jgi:hypothetical protein
MKCAAELIAIAKEAEYRSANGIQTIEWCETVLSKYLESQAKYNKNFAHGGWTWEYVWSEKTGHAMHLDYTKGLYNLRPLLPYYTYANGECSFTPSDDPDDELNFFVIQKYCKKHCIEVEFQENNYKEYGSGCRSGIRLRFRLSPECFK